MTHSRGLSCLPGLALLLSFLLFANLIRPASVAAVELNGTVADVVGKQIQIDLAGDLLPQPGDRVQVHQEVPGVGSLPVKGQWQVTAVDDQGIIAEPVGEAGQPRTGQAVVITSEQPQSLDQASRSAKQTHLRAWDYFKGRNGVAQDEKKGVALLRQAAAQGYAPAQSDLGYRYEVGQGVDKDLNESFVWTRKAALQGHALAQCSMGMKYHHGTGVEQDRTEATKWFLKAAAQGHLISQSMVGTAYFNGNGVEQDYRTAASWYEKAAGQGHASSQCLLGIMYAKGQGMAQDPVTARQWFEKAAAQNDSCGQKQMGFVYWEEKDMETALQYFKLAADQGDASGQRLVGYFYEKGYGVAKDRSQALDWYRQAAAQGDQEARKKIKALGADTPKKTKSKQGRKAAVPAGARQYITMIRSADGRTCQKGAKQLHRSAYAKDAQVLAAVNQALLDGYKAKSEDRSHVDAMAWLCNILGASGDRRYAKTLETVSRQSTSRKIKKYAEKNLRQLK